MIRASPNTSSHAAAARLLVPAYVAFLPWAWAAGPYNTQWLDLLVLALAVWLLATRGARAVSFTWLDAAVLLYVGGLSVSLLDAPSGTRGVIDLAKSAYLVVLYLCFGALLRDDDVARRSVRWLAGGAVIASVAGLLYIAGYRLIGYPAGALGLAMQLPYLGEVLRLKMGFFTPEMFGNYLTAALPFVLGWRPSPGATPRTPFIVVAISAVAFAEVLTFSHSWAGFAAAGFVFASRRGTFTSWPWTRRALAAGVVALVLVINVASIVYVRDFSLEVRTVPAPARVPGHVVAAAQWPHVDAGATYNVLYYFVLKVMAWNLFLQHPVNGVGVGEFPQVTREAYTDGRLTGCWGCVPHSTPFGQLAETGLIGTAAWLGLCVGAVVAGRRLLRNGLAEDDRWIATAVLAALSGLFINSINADIMHFRFVWLLLAFLRGRSLAHSNI